MRTRYLLKKDEDGNDIYVSDVHEILYEILVEFDRICQKHQIDYVLAYGSMLGAVRHQGFIPWDDDLDILMLREDYFKLVDVLDSELSSNFYAHCYEYDQAYNVLLPSMKIKRKDTLIVEKTPLLKNRIPGDGLFIDIFIFDSMSESKAIHFVHRFLSTCLMPPIILLDNLGIEPKWLKKTLYNYSNWYAEKHKNSSDAYLPLTWTFDGFKDRRIKKSAMFPSKKIYFHNGYFPGAADPDEVLTVMYGPNYLEVPDIKYQEPKHIQEIVININKSEDD